MLSNEFFFHLMKIQMKIFIIHAVFETKQELSEI